MAGLYKVKYYRVHMDINNPIIHKTIIIIVMSPPTH